MNHRDKDFGAQAKSNYIVDYISGNLVEGGKEEIEGVQVFSRRLVEDFGYPKDRIITHPQYRVRKSPSDEEKSYPVDIAVFKSEKKIEEDLFLLTECKSKEKDTGLEQLKLYMSMSTAEIGVWFNGNEHAYIRKIHHRNGSITYEEIPNIPRFGQRIADIGLYKRKDLKKPSNLRVIFRDIRNHLAGMTAGITRDEPMARELINILFCKIYDEQETAPEDTVLFRAGVEEDSKDIQTRLFLLFEKVKKVAYDDVFLPADTIDLDAESLRYIVGELQNYCITEADRDAIGDAFEIFIGNALKGPEGQFFTPRNVVKMMVSILDPKPGENIIDPACGSGGFLITCLEHVWHYAREEGKRKSWNDRQLLKNETKIATTHFRGIEKDAFLSKVSKSYMALVGDGRGGIFCENSLKATSEWSPLTQNKIKLGNFDVVITNPPFGKKIVVKGKKILSQYDLGYKWKHDTKTDKSEKTSKLHEDQPPQILFLERCLQLLRFGGRLGIVLPEAVFGMPTYNYVVTFLRQNVKIKGIISMPEALFKTSGKGGTHAKVCVLFVEKSPPDMDYPVFMADARWCGHDSRGNPTYRILDGQQVLLDDVPLIEKRYLDIFRQTKITSKDRFGFVRKISEIKNDIFIPKYYDPELEADLKKLAKTHDLTSIGELVRQNVLAWNTGIEIGKMAYGTGDIPFIRTSDISNWELKSDPKQNISEEIYGANQQDVKSKDIFVVRDGTYLVGTSCILTEHDTKILYCGGIYKLRALKESLDPYLLLALLNTPIVKRQMKSKQFTRDIIDTLGRRLFEVLLPVPKDSQLKKRIADETRNIIESRVSLRNHAKEIVLEAEGRQKVESITQSDINFI